MNVLYDGNIFSLQAAGGITRYFGNLIGRLPLDISPSLILGHTDNSNPASHPNLRIYEYDRVWLAEFSYRLSLYGSRIRNRMLQRVLVNKHFDILHPTYYTLLKGESLRSYRCPVVITVHDMIDELFSSDLDPTGRYAEEKRSAIEAADKIICVSQNTKKDLLERYAIPESKVAVTYLASEIDASLSHGPEPVPARPYYLYVGSRASYKNFNGMLNAFAKVISVRPELALCVVGSPLTMDEKNRISELKLTDNVEHYAYATDPQLAKLYRCSLALVYPSFYEGFGLPPLEAMSCGAVAVVSNVSSLPEVVGKAGVLFDPYRVDELIDILLSLVDDSSKRERLIANGLSHSQQFSWAKTVAETVAVYRAVAE